MKILLLFLFIVVLVVCNPFRLLLFNFFKSLRYSIKDTIDYFRYHKWNNAPTGFIDCYTGLFGRGKTLSAVHYCVEYYNRYNNKLVRDPYSGTTVRQYVNILSNVKLVNVPYKPFESMQQIVDIAEHGKEFNESNDCVIVTLVLLDEASTQLNSRNFKSNLPTPVLNSILTCRHHNIAMVLTSQRFGHMDALLRQVTSHVIECKKLWRLQCHSYYDAWDLEQAGSSLKLKPQRSSGFFVTDDDYAAYDSAAVVDNFVKDYKDGNFYSEDVILLLQGNQQPDVSNARSRSRRIKKAEKKKLTS